MKTISITKIGLVFVATLLLLASSPEIHAAPSGFRLPFVGPADITAGPGPTCNPYHGGKDFERSAEAIDFGLHLNTPVYATEEGTVIFSGWATGLDAGFGNLIKIEHLNGLVSYYAHLSNDIPKKTGDRVLGGERIASSGSTGNSSGPHLHFEVRKGNSPISIRDLPGIIKWDPPYNCTGKAIGPNVVGPPAPPISLSVHPSSPPSGSRFEIGTVVTLAWTGNGDEYYVEESGAASRNSGWTRSTSWSVDATALGTHTWRVKTRKGAEENSWSEIWSFTITQPSANKPIPKGTDNGSSSVYGTSIILSWDGNADEYFAEEWGAASGNSAWTRNKSWGLGATPVGTHYWHVKARKGGVESGWSDTWSFTIMAQSQPPQPPPSLLWARQVSPPNGSSYPFGTEITLSFEGNGDDYYIEERDETGALRGNSGWSKIPWGLGKTFQGTHNWRVKTRKGTQESDWSETWSFTITAQVAPQPPPQPLGPATRVAPSNNTQFNPGDTIVFQWMAIAGAEQYHILVSEPETKDFYTGATNYPYTPSKPGSYSWTVNYKMPGKDYGPGADPYWTFTVGAPAPVVPVPAPTVTRLSPPNGTQFNVGDPINFAWNAIPGAEQYHILVAGPETKDFYTGVTNYPYAPSKAGSYSWTVNVKMPGQDYGPGADPYWTFTVIAPPPPPPAPIPIVARSGPSDKQTFSLGQQVVFAWGAIPGAEQYHILVSGPETKDFYTGGTNYPYTPSKAGNYSWTVNVKMPGQDYGPGADPYWSFSVVVPPPPTVTRSAPANNQQFTLGQQVVFSWGAITGAEQYHILVAGPETKDFYTGATNYPFTPTKGGTYEWTVNVKTPGQDYGPGADPYWKFTVIAPPTVTPPPTPPPQPQTVTIYRDANYQGAAQPWTGPGQYKVPDDFQASSISIPAGYSVMVYERSNWSTDSGGGLTCLSSSLADFASRNFDNGHQLNDRVTSLIVYDHPGCQ